MFERFEGGPWRFISLWYFNFQFSVGTGVWERLAMMTLPSQTPSSPSFSFNSRFFLYIPWKITKLVSLFQTLRRRVSEIVFVIKTLICLIWCTIFSCYLCLRKVGNNEPLPTLLLSLSPSIHVLPYSWISLFSPSETLRGRSPENIWPIFIYVNVGMWYLMA